MVVETLLGLDDRVVREIGSVKVFLAKTRLTDLVLLFRSLLFRSFVLAKTGLWQFLVNRLKTTNWSLHFWSLDICNGLKRR